MAQFSNPNNHNFIAYAILNNMDDTTIDSVRLFDDGQHGDDLANDGIWGNSYPPFSEEKSCYIDISTRDTDNGRYLYLYDLARFTTIGPVVVYDYYFYGSDTIPNHGDQSLKLKLILKNNGTSATAANISATLTSCDCAAFVQLTSNPDYGNIYPGQISATAGFYRISFNNVYADSIYVPFSVEIASDNYVFWSDTFFIFVHKDPSAIEKLNNSPLTFTLNQNYPNPFNPKTKITYQLPAESQVYLSVYNSLGQKIEVIVSERQQPGVYEYEWNASKFAGGIYYCRLSTYGESSQKTYVKVKKMILIK